LQGLFDRSRALRSRRWAPFLWAALAVGAGLIGAPLDPNLLEEGIVVHTAERMIAGDHLYRDVISHTGPLPYELLAALFRLFGSEIVVARLAVVALQGVAAAALYAAARRAKAGVFAHAATAALVAAPVLLIPLFSTYFYSTLAFYLGVISVYAGLRGIGSTRWAVAAGALVAAIALCKQNTGVLFAVTFVPAVMLAAPTGERATRGAGVVLGGITVAVFTLLVYALRGDLSDFVYAQVELPFAMASHATFRTPYINLWPPGVLSPVVRESWVMYLPSLYHLKYGLFAQIGPAIVVVTQLLYALPFIALALTLARALRGGLHPALWIHGGFLLAMAANLYPRADWGHLVVALPPTATQLLLLAGTGRWARARPARAAAWLTVAVFAAATLGVGHWLHRIAGPPSFGPRVPLKPVSRNYRGPAVPRVIQYLRHHVRPNEAIFIPRQEPLLYFATGTRNATPFEGVLPGLRAWQEPLILEALAGVRYVVMSDIDQPIYTYYGDELPAVQAYLERHFRIPSGYPLDDYSWINVLVRGRDRGRTVFDFVDERDRGRAWIRDASGRELPAREAPQRLAAKLLNRPLPIVLGPGGGGIDFDLVVPEGAEFQAGVGYRGLVSIDHQYLHPPGTTLVVAIARGGEFEAVEELRIDDAPTSGRRWMPVQVDLSAYAGERVTLRLEVRVARPLRGDRLAWWGSPRIAVRDAAK
jgi:hypothetical protein